MTLAGDGGLLAGVATNLMTALSAPGLVGLLAADMVLDSGSEVCPLSVSGNGAGGR